MIRRHYSDVVATLALVVALTMGGAVAAGKLTITSKDIKNGSVKTQDIAKNGVRAADIKNGAVKSADIGTAQVTSADIGTGQVTPQDVTMPPPEQLQRSASEPAVGSVAEGFELVASMGAYEKVDPGSALEVTWTGTAEAGMSPCVFQLRVDGAPTGGGEVYVGGMTMSVSASALFEGLPAGAHQIQIWARSVGAGGRVPCTVGPASAGISQAFVITEQVS